MMTEKTFYLEAFDGRKMYFHQWTGDAEANLVLIHGMGEHSGRYKSFASYFVERGINVYAIDLFGHGKTEGPRGHTPKMEDYLWQIDFIVGMIQQLKAPLFLYGHSMGGGLVLNYLFRKNPRIAGVIASAPAIETAFEVPKSKLFLGRMGRKLMPALTQRNGINVDALSKDKSVINAYHADPLVHDIISAEVGIGVIEWGKWLAHLGRDAVATSLLVMHGDKDEVTSPIASERFASKFHSGDVTFKSWKGLYHELHNEPEKEEVLSFVSQWIKSRI